MDTEKNNPMSQPNIANTDFCLPVPLSLLKVLCRLQWGGFRTVVVGGALRDHQRGCSFSDYDLASDALPRQVQQLFRRCLATGLQHGTVTILQGWDSYQITSFRSDGIYKDGRHPESVEFTGDLLGDLARRDFTINAMAFEPDGQAARELLQQQTAGQAANRLLPLRGWLHDPHGGRQHLQQGIISAIGQPLQRFAEDALRMLRACRFSATLGFRIEAGTLTAIRQLQQNLSQVSRPRIQTELSKLLCGPFAVQGLRYLADSGLWYQVFPPPQDAAGEVAPKAALPILLSTAQSADFSDLESLWQLYREFLQAEKPQPQNWLSDLFCLTQKLPDCPYLQWHASQVPQLSLAWALLHLARLRPVGSLQDPQMDGTAQRELELLLDFSIYGPQNRGRKTLTSVDNTPLNLPLGVAERGLRHLPFSRREQDAALQLLGRKQLIWGLEFLYIYRSFAAEGQRHSLLRRYLAALGPQLCYPALCLLGLCNQRAAEMGVSSIDRSVWRQLLADLQLVLVSQSALDLKGLAVNGKILARDCGIPGGPHTGTILQKLLQRVLERPQDNQTEILKNYAQKLYRQINGE